MPPTCVSSEKSTASVKARVLRVGDGSLGGRVADRDVAAKRIVGRSLVGDDVELDAVRGQPRNRLGRIRNESDHGRAPVVADRGHRFRVVVGREVDPAVAQPPFGPDGIDLDDEGASAVLRNGESLGGAHAAEPRGQDSAAGERPVEMLVGDRAERLVGEAENPLRPDVEPAGRRHLSEHRQACILEAMELFLGRPGGHEHRGGDQHPWRVQVARDDRDRASGLHDEGLVIGEPLEGGHDTGEVAVAARSLSVAAVDDEARGIFGDVWIEVVQQAAKRSFLLPSAAAQGRAARGAGGRVERRRGLVHRGDCSVPRVSGTPLLVGLAGAGGASLALWLAALLDPARPWDLQPQAEDDRVADPASWPPVTVVVPARNEAAYLPRTLPALLEQDYPAEWRVVVVDDRSDDGTAGVARSLADERLTVLEGGPLPAGWAGKVWALGQGIAAAGAPEYLLLTDADILHTPSSLRALVADAEANGLALTSRMARLHCRTLAERLVIPPFLFFFNVLYPMRRVGDPADTRAAAAGGCILVRRQALEGVGGISAVRGEVIDDVNLARVMKASGGRIRLAVSRDSVTSLRKHSLGSAWRMVRRTAFDELRYSWLRLAGAVGGLTLLFVVPPGLVGLAIGGGAPGVWRLALGLLGGAAWTASAVAYLPTVRLFGLGPLWSATLPAGGLLYAGMTVDSALQHVRARGGRTSW